MTTTPLLIRVHDTRTGIKKTQGFAQSPVRVGRNKLNELVLDSQFVSQWHAVVRFDAKHTVYVDLGSTNGTVVDGKRVEKNLEVTVDERVELSIGDLRLRFARSAIPQDVQISQRSTTFMLHAQATQVGQLPATMPSREPMLASERVATEAEVARPSPQEQAWFSSVAEHIRPLHDAVVSANAQLGKHLEHYLSQAPEASRARLLNALVDRYPVIARSDSFGPMLTRLKIDPTEVGDVDLDAWFNRILYGSPVAPPNARRLDKRNALERVGATLEAFAQSFVDLRAGYRQFTAEIAVRTSDESQLGRATDARRVLAYLFDPNSDPQVSINELARSFADLAYHQVALVGGVVEGMRSVMTQLSPQSAYELPANAEVPQPTGIAAVAQAAKLSSAWKRYVTTHQGLLENDRFAREMFGRAFAKAYYAVTGEKLDAVSHIGGANATSGHRALK